MNGSKKPVSAGAPGVLMGTARLLTCMAELPAFRMSARILKALGTRTYITVLIDFWQMTSDVFIFFGGEMFGEERAIEFSLMQQTRPGR